MAEAFGQVIGIDLLAKDKCENRYTALEVSDSCHLIDLSQHWLYPAMDIARPCQVVDNEQGG